jgi:PadR family transcriptional regulator PadR
MPQGRRCARRRMGQAHRIRGFVEPCLLLLLHRDDTHGYEMLDQLEEFGLGHETLDSSVVYRSLREMEERGLVVSSWDTEGQGPPRRVYRLTPEGDRYLASWIGGLRNTRDVLDRFLRAYETHMRLEDHPVLVERIAEVDNRI